MNAKFHGICIKMLATHGVNRIFYTFLRAQKGIILSIVMCQGSIKSHTSSFASFNLRSIFANFLCYTHVETSIFTSVYVWIFEFSYIYVKNGTKNQAERSIIEGHPFWSALSQYRAKNTVPFKRFFRSHRLIDSSTGNELPLTRPIMRVSRV